MAVQVGQQGAHRGVVGFAVERGTHACELGEPVGRRRVTLVGDVVAVAREAVQRHHGRSQRARHEHRRHRKVLVVVDAGDGALQGIAHRVHDVGRTVIPRL